MELKEKLLEKLKEVLDPEIGINIVDLGLVYNIKIQDKLAEIRMTFTSPMCPVGPIIVESVEEKAAEMGFKAEVEIVFEPAWNPDMMSEEAKLDLGLS